MPNAGKPLKWIQQHLLLAYGAWREARSEKEPHEHEMPSAESRPYLRSTHVLLGCLLWPVRGVEGQLLDGGGRQAPNAASRAANYSDSAHSAVL